MNDSYTAAAQSLIIRLAAPAQWHSVWIRTDVAEGEFTRSLCVSVRPGHEAKITVPAEHQGIPVVNVPWPKEQM